MTKSTATTAQLCYVLDNTLYLNISDRCTLKCQFCPKTNGSTVVGKYDLALSSLPTAEQVIEQLPEDLSTFDEVVFCGFGESTLRLNVLMTVAKHIKQSPIRIRLNTDGLANLAHRRNILPLLSKYIDALSISLNAHNQEVYDRICQPAFKNAYPALLQFIQLAPSYIPDVQVSAINNLPGVNIAACRELAASFGVRFKQRELDVIV